VLETRNAIIFRRALSTMVKAPLAPPAKASLVDLTQGGREFVSGDLWATSACALLVLRRPG